MIVRNYTLKVLHIISFYSSPVNKNTSIMKMLIKQENNASIYVFNIYYLLTKKIKIIIHSQSEILKEEGPIILQFHETSSYVSMMFYQKSLGKY